MARRIGTESRSIRRSNRKTRSANFAPGADPNGDGRIEQQRVEGKNVTVSESGHDLADRLAEFQVEPLVAGDFELARGEAQEGEQRGVDVGDVVRMLDGVEAQLVGRAVDDAPLEAAAGHPDRKAVRMMVA